MREAVTVAGGGLAKEARAVGTVPRGSEDNGVTAAMETPPLRKVFSEIW